MSKQKYIEEFKAEAVTGDLMRAPGYLAGESPVPAMHLSSPGSDTFSNNPAQTVKPGLRLLRTPCTLLGESDANREHLQFSDVSQNARKG